MPPGHVIALVDWVG